LERDKIAECWGCGKYFFVRIMTEAMLEEKEIYLCPKCHTSMNSNGLSIDEEDENSSPIISPVINPWVPYVDPCWINPWPLWSGTHTITGSTYGEGDCYE